jgi:hypothetical protein
MRKGKLSFIFIAILLTVVSCENKSNKRQNSVFVHDLPSDGKGKSSLFHSIEIIRDFLRLDKI